MLFGTAQIGVRHPTSHWRRLLAVATGVGLSGFDTAPLYADGLAERLTAEAIRQSPDLTVQTKIGLERRFRHKHLPRPFAAASSMVLGQTGHLDETRRLRGVPAIERQLAGSMRRLRGVPVASLLLHEPAADAVSDDLVRHLINVCESGAVGQLGVAGGWGETRVLLRRFPGVFTAVQVPAADLLAVCGDGLPAGILLRVHGLVRWLGSRTPDDNEASADVPVRALSALIDTVAGTGLSVQPLVATTSVERVVGWGEAWRLIGPELSGSSQR